MIITCTYSLSSENPLQPGEFIPEVVIPGSDVLPPGIGNDVMVLKKEGESCGSCMCPPTYTAGECERHLECFHNPMIADAPGICMVPGWYFNIPNTKNNAFDVNHILIKTKH